MMWSVLCNLKFVCEVVELYKFVVLCGEDIM